MLFQETKTSLVGCSKKESVMKNPFKQEDNHSFLIPGLLIGAMFAGAITYLYIKKKSELQEAADKLKSHAKDYLKKKAGKLKKHKSDVEDLEGIVGHAQEDQ
jgi:hypothetical protein